MSKQELFWGEIAFRFIFALTLFLLFKNPQVTTPVGVLVGGAIFLALKKWAGL